MTTRAPAFIWVSLLTALLAACGSLPLEYHSQNEIPKGPGVFSGDAGAAVLRMPGTGNDTAVPAPRAVASANTLPAAGTAGNGDYAEFEAFREFRRAKGAKSADYLEFQEWLGWKASREQVKPKPAKGW